VLVSLVEVLAGAVGGTQLRINVPLGN
jgi:hypothetical protein